MDSGSVVSSLSLTHSFDFTKKSAGSSGRMVQKKWSGGSGGRVGGGACGGSSGTAGSTGGGDKRQNNPQENYQRSEISLGTDFSAERPCTRDTNTLLMRDASVLSSQPDRSNFREKMQSWTVYEDTSSPYVAPRPTTSLANQKPSSQMDYMGDIEREMSILMSRPSTTFPVKPKELVEPLEGFLPEDRPVSQKKFLVLPSIGHRIPAELFLRRQRSNLETTNQLDYSRHPLENDAHFFSNFYHHPDQPHYDCIGDSPPFFHGSDPQDSPSKGGQIGTPMPLPPIHKQKWERLRTGAYLAGLEEESPYGRYSGAESQLSIDSDEEDDDLDQFRLKTPETYRSDTPHKPITPPPEFR